MANVVIPIADNPNLYIFWCPGCEHAHHIDTKRWTFDGNLERPTVSPSLLNYAGNDTPRCHIFVKAGRIQYLGDCTHDLAGQTVEMTPP